jgi:hypothetical protein
MTWATRTIDAGAANDRNSSRIPAETAGIRSSAGRAREQHNPHAAVVKELAAQLEAWQTDKPPVPVIEGVAPEPNDDVSAPVAKVKRKDRNAKQAGAP